MDFLFIHLRAVGIEFLGEDAHRHAGAAAVAVRAIGEGAAAAETRAHQLAVDGRVDQVARGRDLRARHPLRQVAAWVGRSRIELQDRERKITQ